MDSLSIAPAVVPAGTTPATTRTATTSLTRDVTAELKITTRDGDTVTLDASYDQSVTYTGALGRHGHRGAWNAQAQTSSSLKLQVTGELSPQETAQIAAVVRRFLHDLRGLESGHDVSLANVAKGNPNTLQSVSATATTQTTLTVNPGMIDHAPTPLPVTDPPALA